MKEYVDRNPKIEILPEHIIDQIKAGEVLERPASLVKELIENSLDAQSTEINLHLVENGLDLLSIEDNGHGMTFENLPYAFLRHATSKLKSYEDLYNLHSFGFRGEALASVAAIARLTCTTQPKDLNHDGGKLIINGGVQELLIANRSNRHGTSLFIKDLFYNTPARLKFIKSKISEKSALRKIIYSFVLTHPAVNFSIKWDEKEREIFRPDTPLNRAIQVFFPRTNKEIKGDVWNSSEEYDGYKVESFFSPSTYSTPQYRHHYLFANDRFFQDKSFHSAILRTLDSLWRFGESGHYIIKISVPPTDIDVNVHPNKTQIKFLKMDVIYSLLVSSLKSAIKKNSVPVLKEQESLNPVQEQFFTREENQNFDLQNMINPIPFSSSISLNSSSSQNLVQNNSLLLATFPPNYMLLKVDQKIYVADLKMLMADFLTHSFKNFILTEEMAGPLLISEPLKANKGKIDKHLDDLKLLGLEIDRLNPEVLALRTLPRFIPQSFSRDITQLLIKYFEQSRVTKYEEEDFKIFVANNWTSEKIINEDFLEKILNLAREGLVEMTEQNIKGLFK